MPPSETSVARQMLVCPTSILLRIMSQPTRFCLRFSVMLTSLSLEYGLRPYSSHSATLAKRERPYRRASRTPQRYHGAPKAQEIGHRLPQLLRLLSPHRHPVSRSRP